MTARPHQANASCTSPAHSGFDTSIRPRVYLLHNAKENLPAPEAAQEPCARLQGANEHPGRPERATPSYVQGTRAADRLSRLPGRHARLSMPRGRRLTRPADFAAARREGKSWHSALLVLRARPNGLAVSRFGFSVSKAVGGAVVRNRVKRRLREAARLIAVRQGWDLVLVARRDAGSADFHSLRRSMTSLLRRAGVLERKSPDAGTP